MTYYYILIICSPCLAFTVKILVPKLGNNTSLYTEVCLLKLSDWRMLHFNMNQFNVNILYIF